MTRNDGRNDVAYNLVSDVELNERLSGILNELCPVFHMHADGHWKSYHKPKYTTLIGAEILRRPSLIRKLLALNDPVVSNVTYAAIESNRLHPPPSADAGGEA